MNGSSKLWTAQFVAIILMAFLFFCCLQLLTAGFPAFVSHVNHNPAQAGMMTTAFMISAIITRPFVGGIIHKANIKKVNIASLIFLAVTIALSYHQKSVSLLLFLRILHGIAFGIVSTIISTMATTVIPVRRLGEGIGYYGMATSVGTSLAPMFALSLIQFFSFNALLLLAVLLVIVTLLLNIFIRSPHSNRMRTKEVSFIEYAFDKKAFSPCLLASFFTITLGGVVSFLGELGKEVQLGGSVSLFFLIIAVTMAIVRPLSGRIFDSKGHKVILYPAIVSGIIGLCLLAATQDIWTLLLAGVFYGIAYGTITPTLQALAVSFVSKEKQGTANAMFFSFMDLGMAIGSISLGVLASYTGYRLMYGYSIVCLVVLLVTYIFLFLRHKRAVNAMDKVS
ncbi:MFS transporter [Thermaerobacillus caldiproteolyticus]|uniref:MFS transporter n=1 Tax=Thermaerobacillus caldiproteolyticus TaxID=247480 RepID=UPI0018F252B3|nr:MFS transporter [Anoxybacillus caldiproteolyticus]